MINVSLYSAMQCAPCWRRDTCDFNRECLNRIDAASVLEAVEQRLARPRGPLVIDRLVI